MFYLSNTIKVTACNGNVPNIDNQLNITHARMAIKEQVQCLNLGHAKLLNNIAKCAKPSSRRLLEATQICKGGNLDSPCARSTVCCSM